MLSNLTLIIPTINRSNYLKRALKYYSSMRFKGKILIGDSSDDFHKKEIRKTLDKIKNLDVDYRYFNKLDYSNDALVLSELSNFIKTKYVTFAGDDDFLVPSGAEDCIFFLEEHPEFSAAHGLRLNYILNNNKVVHIDVDTGYEWIKENAWERWCSYMQKGIATVSFIHRIDNWKEQYKYVEAIPCRYIGTELLMCSIAAIQGMVKALPTLSLVFQRETPERIFSFNDYTLWDLINSPDWSESSHHFVSIMISLLNKKGFDKTKEIKKIFWHHCLSVQVHQFNNLGKVASIPTEPIKMDLEKDDPFLPIYKIINRK